MIKDSIMKCLVQAGCLIGFQLLCFMPRDCKCTMICLCGMPKEQVTNCITKTMKEIILLRDGGNGSANTTKAVMYSCKKESMIGDLNIFSPILRIGLCIFIVGY